MVIRMKQKTNDILRYPRPITVSSFIHLISLSYLFHARGRQSCDKRALRISWAVIKLNSS